MDDSATAGSASEPAERTDEHKRDLVQEYDATDFRGRQGLLEREGMTIRDIARWRREFRAAAASATTARPAEAKRAKASSGKPAKRVASRSGARSRSSAEGPPRVAAKRVAAGAQAATDSAAAATPLSATELGSGATGGGAGLVAAHVSALIYHAEILQRLLDEPAHSVGGRRRRSTPLERLAKTAQDLSAAAKDVLRQDGTTETSPRNQVDVVGELQEMVLTLTDYASLSTAVQLLSRELDPTMAAEMARSAIAGGSGGRSPWWGPSARS